MRVTRWLLVLLVLCGACDAPVLPCSAVIDRVAFLRKMSDASMAAAVGTCERNAWPADAKKCLVEATSEEELRGCAIKFQISPSLGGT